MNLRTVVSLLQSTVPAWQQEDASRLATLAHGTTFSFQGQLVDELSGRVVQQRTDTIQGLIFGAMGVLSQLQR